MVSVFEEISKIPPGERKFHLADTEQGQSVMDLARTIGLNPFDLLYHSGFGEEIGAYFKSALTATEFKTAMKGFVKEMKGLEWKNDNAYGKAISYEHFERQDESGEVQFTLRYNTRPSDKDWLGIYVYAEFLDKIHPDTSIGDALNKTIEQFQLKTAELSH